MYCVSDLQEVLFYIEFGPGKTITFHRGGKEGKVIATAETCEDKQGTSRIEFVESSTKVALEHLPRRMVGILPPKTTFEVEGKKYHWKGYTDLIDESNNKLVAQYTAIELEGSDNKTGNLVISEGEEKIFDLAVFSTMVQQHRSDARTRAVIPRATTFC